MHVYMLLDIPHELHLYDNTSHVWKLGLIKDCGWAVASHDRAFACNL
jgi:hypothetical protein